MKRITVLGSTGSIGCNTLDIVRRRSGEFGIYALVAGRNVELLAEQIVEFSPTVAVVSDPALLPRLAELLNAAGLAPSRRPELAAGQAAYVQAAIAPERMAPVNPPAPANEEAR